MTRRRLLLRFATFVAVTLAAGAANAQTVSVTVPVGVSFAVNDVNANTAGSPGATQVTYSGPTGFAKSDKLRVLVKADASTFAGPGSTHPAASKVSWTASASSGTASNGTLSSAAYTQVYVTPGNLKPTESGSVSIVWTLAPIAAAGLRSGNHTLTMRWRFEAF